MDLVLPTALLGLALVDSTSIGTLGVPALMLARERVAVRAFLIYLATISLFYWGLGLVILGLGGQVSSLIERAALSDDALDWGQLVVGAALLGLSFVIEPLNGPRTTPRSSRRAERLLQDPSTRTVVVTALGAGVLEAATMLPYLGAIGLLATSGWSPFGQAGALAAYVVVMALPALLLLGIRLVANRWLQPILAWVQARLFGASMRTTAAWVVGVIGVLLALDATQRLGLWERLATLG